MGDWLLHSLGLGRYCLVGIASILLLFGCLPLILAWITSLRQEKQYDWQRLHSSLYVGRVWHTRHGPVKHAFTYPLFIFAIDLAEVEEGLFTKTLWPLSLLVQFRTDDHLKDHERQVTTQKEGGTDSNNSSLQDRIHAFAAQQTERKVQTSKDTHRIILVTHLAYYGYCFNPVSFYYIVSRPHQQASRQKQTYAKEAQNKMTAVVAEVSNTPWNEMYNYVLHPHSMDMTRVERQQDSTRFVFPKKFHVSPFMEMAYDYDWVFRDWEDEFRPDNIHITTAMRKPTKENAEGPNSSSTLQFSATMDVQRRSMYPVTIAWQIVTYPCYCMILQIWIHYQAFWLFWKGVTFQPHPEGAETTASRIIGSIMAPFFAVQDWLSNRPEAKKTS